MIPTSPNKISHKQFLAFKQRTAIEARKAAEEAKTKGVHIEFWEALPEELRDWPSDRAWVGVTKENEIRKEMSNKKLAAKLNSLGYYTLDELSLAPTKDFSIFEKMQIKLLLN